MVQLKFNFNSTKVISAIPALCTLYILITTKLLLGVTLKVDQREGIFSPNLLLPSLEIRTELCMLCFKQNLAIKLILDWF